MKLFAKVLLSLVAFMFVAMVYAQEVLTKDDIIVRSEKRADGRFRITSIKNIHDTTVDVTLHDTGGSRVLSLNKDDLEQMDWCVVRITAHSMRTPTKEIEIFRSSAHLPESNTGGEAVQSEPAAPTTPAEPEMTTPPAQPTAQTTAQTTTVPATLPQGQPSTHSQEEPSQTEQQETASLPTTQQDTLAEGNKTPLDSVGKDSIRNLQNALASQGQQSVPWKLVGVVAGVVLLCLLLLLWYVRTNRKQHRQQSSSKKPLSTHDDSDSFVVIGKKTQTILKQQSLDDVYDNETYIKIECNDFCSDSAVRVMYLKNTCIKDIYNMYAEDLRNPENPKEDGCMVLGRWLFDERSQQYDVTLESIVLPGDDAVFDEYELSFGGKIKLKVREKLRKLRRETNLQYDLTCWVHSHPGLGVFFSNYDENVHLQLKHPMHPKFLTALVIDILTPQLEMGIFTFKNDMTVSSKSDLKKTYSLEDLYQRALESERSSFDASTHYNILEGCREHLNSCYSIQLSNGAIIDMTFLMEKPTGFVTFAHGFTIERGERTQCVISNVSRTEIMADNRVLGCLVVASHCSIPSIRKVVAPYLGYIRFVLVYTNDNGLLTAIPVTNQDITPDTAYHGEQKLEELKIWTRRRR